MPAMIRYLEHWATAATIVNETKNCDPDKYNLEKYDVVQNSAVRIITGGAKSTPITVMQLYTGIEPLDSHRDKFTLKFGERARRVDCRYWNEYRCETQRLKTQTSLSHAELLMKKHQLPLLMTPISVVLLYQR
ncbi:hypothetical protein TNCV_2393591 [Trichonephila clavipes]|nr:hypothetical protein TNCV_2393591 [Trichonephila clavipes]